MRVVELATSMFARETGFSGPVLHRLFAEYTDELGEYTGWGGGADSRWQIFQRGLLSICTARCTSSGTTVRANGRCWPTCAEFDVTLRRHDGTSTSR